MTPQTEWVRSIEEFRKELEGASDRATITIGGGLLELGLEECLLSVFREPKDNTEKSHLFSGGGIVETFSQKIWACYFLKIVSLRVRNDLDTIRKIRNIAAHELNPISFQDQRISDLCRNLSVSKVTLADAQSKKQFVTTVMMYAGLLISRSLVPENGEIGADQEPISGLGGGVAGGSSP